MTTVRSCDRHELYYPHVCGSACPAPAEDRDEASWPVLGTCGKMRNKDLFQLCDEKHPRAEQCRRAIAVCSWCPVLRQCRDYAVSTGQNSGIWGGLDMRYRRRRTRPTVAD
ncbi:WhiB family transcriptional regulator [Rhodococcus qingshengii]|uniref:WhiB family transcriptional regulator n=1 Tax=Rhodococcus qingshengii TaxID=334542 RepID=UPI00365A3A66